VAIAGAHQERTLTAALANRDIIGQAKGIVMERFHFDAVAACRLITRLSQTSTLDGQAAAFTVCPYGV